MKTTMATKENYYGVFGWTEIKSNNCSALSNGYKNWNELRKELRGKPISEKTIVDAMRKVKFDLYEPQSSGVHSFFPEAGKCYIGKENGKFANVLIEWSVDNNKEILQELKEIKSLLQKLAK